jgi:hypothetical protein
MCTQLTIDSPCVDLAAQFGFSVALSADGATLVAGASGDVSGSPGINGEQYDDSALMQAGAVYVF